MPPPQQSCFVWSFEDPRRWRNDLKSTDYFKAVRSRPDRQRIMDDWILRVVEAREHEQIQDDGRIRRWARIHEAEGRYLRVVLLPDGETMDVDAEGNILALTLEHASTRTDVSQLVLEGIAA